jgi:NAD(P)H-hydrate repair Nnr-like enzyme with NAD(P)H-hydrate dehydratase domain
MIKIYKMNDCDYVAAENIDDAKKALEETLGYEQDPEDMPFVLTEKEMEKLKFLDCEPGSEESKDPKNKRSFKAQLEKMVVEGEKFPCFFASSEF